MQRVLRMIVCLLSLLPAAVLVGQELEVAKSRAEIRMEVVTTLPDSIGDWRDHSIVVDSRGKYYEAQGPMGGNGGHIFAFDAHGTFLKSFGGVGRGPGEYALGIFALAAGSADTLYVFERYRDYTVLSPTTHAYVRGVKHPRVELRPLAIGPSRFVAVVRDSMLLPNGGPRFGLAIFGDSSGLPTRTFGFPKDAIWRTLPCIAGTGTIWSPTGTILPSGKDVAHEYRLEAWDTLGKRHQLLVRRPSWWSKPLSTAYCDVDEQGLIWVFSLIERSPDSKLGARSPQKGGLGKNWGTYTTWVEVIDPRRKMVVASQEFSEGIAAEVGHHMAFVRREDENGETSIAIVHFRLAQQPHPRR